MNVQIEKTLACGDTGIGAMAHTDVIAETVRQKLVALSIQP